MRLFEIGKLFLAKEQPLVQQPEERRAMIIGVMGEKEDFFSLKSIVEALLSRFGVKGIYTKSEEPFLHPGRQAQVTAGGKCLGVLGEVHPDTAAAFEIEGRPLLAQIDLAQLFALSNLKVLYRPLPKYPPMVRDLAVLVDASQEIGPMLEAIASAGGSLVTNVELFDIYKSDSLGEGKMSVAFSITMLNPERTLKYEEAQKVFDKIVRSLEYRFGAALRS